MAPASQARAEANSIGRSTPDFRKETSMQIMQCRRDFLASACPRPAPLASLAPGASLADEAPPEITTIRLRHDPGICVAPWYIAEDLLRAEGFTDIRYVSAARPPATLIARGEIDFELQIRSMGRLRPGCRRADHGAGGCASRVLRAVRARAHPHHQRPEGQEGRHPMALARAATCTWRSWWRRSGSTRTRTSNGSRNADGDSMELFAEGKSMPFSVSRPSRRSCAPARSVT